MNIIGAQKPNNYFYMRYSPQECEFNLCVHTLCVHFCVVTMHQEHSYSLFFLFIDKSIAESSSKEGNDKLLIIFMYLSSQYDFTAEKVCLSCSLTSVFVCMNSGLTLMPNNYCFTVSIMVPYHSLSFAFDVVHLSHDSCST